MRIFYKEFAELHDAMKAIEDRKDAEHSWESRMEREAAQCVRMSLWAIAVNREPSQLFFDTLKKYMAALDAAKAAPGKTAS